ncbi:hypothetical protein Tco_1389104, partial [Tanacetum coccineum]
MYYPRFTKVIINFFMTKDQLIPRRNSVNWHYARDDYMFTTIKAIALGAEPPKTKASVKKKQIGSDKTTTSSTTKCKRLKTSAKTAKPAKKKQPAKTSMDKGLTVLSEVALTEAKQLKLKSSNEEDDDEVSLNDDDDDDDDVDNQHDDDDQEHDDQDDDANDDAQDKDDQDDEHQDDDNEQMDSDNDGDDFVYPKFSTHDDEAKQYEEVNEEDSFDPRVQTPSHVESTDDEIQDANVEGDKMNEEETNDEAKVVALYRDVNVNLEGKDTGMTDAPLPNVQPTQETKDAHMILTALINPEGQQQSSSVSSGFVSNMLNPRPDTGIDSIFTLNTEATSLVNVSVTTIAEPPLVSAITLPPPPTPLIIHMQQTPVPTPTTVSSSSLQNLPNFGSLFGFDHRLKTLETDFSKFKQTNQFAEAVSSIPGIVDAYLANKMHEAVKTVVQLQSERLRDETQAENADFLNKLDDNITKIIKDQVKEQVKAQTSLAIAANLSELELKKILIDKMESNKSIHISDEQKNLYKALVEAYKSDKLILDTYEQAFSLADARTSINLVKQSSTGRRHKQEFGQARPNFFEEVYKATTDQLDWNNPEGQQYPHDLRKPLPLIPNSRGCQVIPFDHFINNNLVYLSSGVSSQTYATSVMKTKHADYGHIKWIEDLVPNTMWSEVPINYDKHALWGISHWGRKCQQFYGFAAN